jgi:3',5'-cyclic AMP phosphodiesterase CpdA
LAHLSDLHFGGEDQDALEAVRHTLGKEQPDAIIVTGDISRSGQAHELAAAFAWIGALPAQAVVVPGNHDVPYYNILGRMIDPFGRFVQAASGNLSPWRTERLAVTPLNTARGIQPRINWAQGAISAAQTAQSLEEIRLAAPGALKIVASHHPLEWPHDSPLRRRTWGGRAAQRAFVGAGARILLHGHLHVACVRRMEEGRAISVSAGTLSRRLRGESCSFILLRQTEPKKLQ